MQKHSIQDQPYVIKISFRLVALGTIVILAIGALGGVVSTYIYQPPLPPLTSNQDRVVTTMQEITISPSKATTELVDRSQRPIVLITQTAALQSNIPAVGIIITNDGYIVSPQDIPGSTFSSIEGDGSVHEISKIGTDQMYGLTYYRYTEGVFPSIELATSDPGEGEQLLTLGRSPDTLFPHAETCQVYEYLLPDITVPPAIQRVLRVNVLNNIALPGDALLNEEGQLAGIMTDPARGISVSASDIRLSLDRIITNKREYNPLREAGLSLKYTFDLSGDKKRRVFNAQVQSVVPGTPASIGGLATGDTLQSINDNEITWNSSIAQLLSTEYPLQLVVERNGQQHTLTLHKEKISE